MLNTVIDYKIDEKYNNNAYFLQPILKLGGYSLGNLKIN